jgi:hypothetical protein
VTPVFNVNLDFDKPGFVHSANVPTFHLANSQFPACQKIEQMHKKIIFQDQLFLIRFFFGSTYIVCVLRSLRFGYLTSSDDVFFRDDDAVRCEDTATFVFRYQKKRVCVRLRATSTLQHS